MHGCETDREKKKIHVCQKGHGLHARQSYQSELRVAGDVTFTVLVAQYLLRKESIVLIINRVKPDKHTKEYHTGALADCSC